MDFTHAFNLRARHIREKYPEATDTQHLTLQLLLELTMLQEQIDELKESIHANQ
jgi:hypothetical protein